MGRERDVHDGLDMNCVRWNMDVINATFDCDLPTELRVQALCESAFPM
jgi:hypothetical protein